MLDLVTWFRTVAECCVGCAYRLALLQVASEHGETLSLPFVCRSDPSICLRSARMAWSKERRP
jgi:hypothetical protein